MDNLILIGMPGAGKSTVGVLLAKRLARDFVDVDLVIQSGEGATLQRIIDERGVVEFGKIEARYTCALECTQSVVATGGSVVYHPGAMAHLGRIGLLVWLRLPLPDLEDRIRNFYQRGLARIPGQTLSDLYAERTPLYERYAQVTIDAQALSHERVSTEVIEQWSRYRHRAADLAQ